MDQRDDAGTMTTERTDFSPETLEKIEAVLSRYPTTQAAGLPVLHLAQKEFGFITDQALRAVARVLHISRVEAFGLATYYSMYSTKPLGRHVIYLCDNLACTLLGAESLLGHLEAKLGVPLGGTTADGRFSLRNAECLGACGQAPVMLVDEDFYEGLTAEKIDAILEKYR